MVLDQLIAPATDFKAPGGLTSRELYNILFAFSKYAPIAADISEYNPSLDIHNLTANLILRSITQICESIILKQSKGYI